MNNNRCVQITYGKIMNAMLLSVDLVDSISHIIVIVDEKHSSFGDECVHQVTWIKAYV